MEDKTSVGGSPGMIDMYIKHYYTIAGHNYSTHA